MAALPQHPTVEALLAHADWVRALARTLVRDPGAADDVAQESWLDALERPPGDARNLRGWLARIVRNAAGQRARSEARRDARERAAARPEALPDTAELVARTELQREVVGHVLSLDEPYRTTVLLRYFQGLEARDIAARQGVPLATVRTRLQRAMGQLRERLDREHGDRASWSAALVTLASGREASATLLSTSSIPIGGALVATAWKVGSAGLAIAAIWWAWRTTAHDGEAPRAALAPQAEAPALVAAPDPTAIAPPTEAPLVEGRSALSADAGPSSAAPKPAAASEIRRVDGRVVDVAGRPVGGLALVAFARGPDGSPETEIAGSRLRGTTAVDGSYAFDVPGRYVHVESADEAWILTCEGKPIGRSESVRVAVPSTSIAGLVVDEAGAPIPGADVGVGFACSALKEFPFALYGVESRSWGTRSAADGSFRFAAVPTGSEIAVARDGYEATRVREVGPDGRIVLRAARPREQRWIRGVVVDAQGAAVAGADVRFGQEGSGSDELGRFEVAVRSFSDATPLTATKRGFLAAVVERFGETVREQPGSLDGTVLRLGGAPLAITGRVLDADGRPCRGWSIDLADGTPSGNSWRTIELDSASGWSAAAPVEFGSSGAGASPHETDADGRFRLDGLRDRTYRVRAFDPSRCLFVVGEPTAAGSEDLVLRVPRDAFLPVLRGRVVSQRGRPIVGGVVRLGFAVQTFASGDEWVSNCREVQADDEGRFEFRDLPFRHLQLRVDGPHVESTGSFAIPASGEVELRASARCRFRVDARPDDAADRFRVLDGDGREMRITAQTAVASYVDGTVQRRDDGFPVCTVGDEAATLVLYQGEVELRRVALELQPNELEVVTP